MKAVVLVHQHGAASGTTRPLGQLQHERGLSFDLGPSFYRPQSCFSRDLAVLSAVVHRRHRQRQQQQCTPAAPPPLHVLDLCAGSGIRSMRYLLQGDADLVLCNDGDPANDACLTANLSAAADAAAGEVGPAAVTCEAFPDGKGSRHWRVAGAGRQQRLELCRHEAISLLMRCRLEGRFFDLIDSDSFGAGPGLVGAALDVVRHGGLVCLTHTAGPIAGGRDPASAQALFSQHLAPLPSVNEQGLRLLLGLACREAAARRLSIQPLWSLYSPHGPVWRTMLRVSRPAQQSSPVAVRRLQQQRYGYTLHWPASGESSSCSFQDMPAALLAAGGGGNGGGGQPVLSGPLWLGPLHDHLHLQEVEREAAARGWLDALAETTTAATAAAAAGTAVTAADASLVASQAVAVEQLRQPKVLHTRNGSLGSLQLLLELLVEEAGAEAAGEAAAEAAAAAAAAAAAPAELGGRPAGMASAEATGAAEAAALMPPWFLRTNDVGRVGCLEGPPSRQRLLQELRRRGHLAARSHIDPSAVKTTASMAQAVAACVDGLGIRSRAQLQPADREC